MPTVTAACVGKAACTLPATNDFFGGDPCVGTVKALAVSMQGSCLAFYVSLDAVVPVGATAVVAVPTLGASAAAVTVSEWSSEAGSTVWTNGRYVAGTPGVTGAVAVTDAFGVTTIQVSVGSGEYAFRAAH